MRQHVISIRRFIDRHPPEAPAVLASVVLAALGAKLGFGLWVLGALICLYPAYLVMLVVYRGVIAWPARDRQRPGMARIDSRSRRYLNTATSI